MPGRTWFTFVPCPRTLTDDCNDQASHRKSQLNACLGIAVVCRVRWLWRNVFHSRSPPHVLSQLVWHACAFHDMKVCGVGACCCPVFCCCPALGTRSTLSATSLRRTRLMLSRPWCMETSLPSAGRGPNALCGLCCACLCDSLKHT